MFQQQFEQEVSALTNEAKENLAGKDVNLKKRTYQAIRYHETLKQARQEAATNFNRLFCYKTEQKKIRWLSQ